MYSGTPRQVFADAILWIVPPVATAFGLKTAVEKYSEEGKLTPELEEFLDAVAKEGVALIDAAIRADFTK